MASRADGNDNQISMDTESNVVIVQRDLHDGETLLPTFPQEKDFNDIQGHYHFTVITPRMQLYVLHVNLNYCIKVKPTSKAAYLSVYSR